MKNKRGITLIALIITIIILVILAGITFNAIAGDNGILSQAMKSKTNTENASAISMVEMAWSARMTKFLEEKDRVVDNLYLKELLVDLNAGLGDSGKIKGIDYNETSNKFTLVYEDESGNNYYMDVDRASGKTSLSENHVEEQTVAEELASSYAVTEKSISKSKLYGTRVETGVTEINGVEVEDNWKIFYVDESDSKVYLIYGDYFPRDALQNTDENDIKINNSTDFSFYLSDSTRGTEDRTTELINYLTNENNWSELSNSLRASGKTFSGKNLTVVGSPSIELWINSYNDKYFKYFGYKQVAKDETIDFHNYLYENNGDDEYCTVSVTRDGVAITKNTRTDPIYYDYDLPSGYLSEGYKDGESSGNSDNLFFPRKDKWNAIGYYLTSPNINLPNGYLPSFNSGLLIASWSGNVASWPTWWNGVFAGAAVRPVVSMSIADFESATAIKVH